MMKDFFKVMQNRKSAREFADYVVNDAEVTAIVYTVRRAPSSKNSQPWKLRLLQGESIEKLRNALCKRFDENAEPNPELNAPLLPAYRKRAIELGKALFVHKGITREDKEARRLHDRANFELFNAPQAFVLGVDREAFHEGTLIDCGIFLGYLLIAIEAAGFACCPQMSPLIYPDALKEVLDDESILFLCIVPFGKPLEGSHVNAFETSREPSDIWFKKI